MGVGKTSRTKTSTSGTSTKDMFTTVKTIAKSRKYKPDINLYRCFPTLESYAIAMKNIQEYKPQLTKEKKVKDEIKFSHIDIF